MRAVRVINKFLTTNFMTLFPEIIILYTNKEIH